MEELEYEKMREYEENYWWHKGKLHLLRSLKEKYAPDKRDLKILEIGCGTGEVLNLLKDWGDVYGLDFSETAVAHCKLRGFTNVMHGDINSVDLSVHKNSYDIVLALDVLEHIREDTETMRRVLSILKPGGLFFVAVPAYKLLWSNHDEALHHLRRYHSLEIRQKLKDSGFKLLKTTHFVATLFFPIALFRLMSNFVRRRAYPKSTYVPVPKIVNNLFAFLLKIESNFIKFMYIPVGTTLVVVAKKPE